MPMKGSSGSSFRWFALDTNFLVSNRTRRKKRRTYVNGSILLLCSCVGILIVNMTSIYSVIMCFIAQ